MDNSWNEGGGGGCKKFWIKEEKTENRSFGKNAMTVFWNTFCYKITDDFCA